MRELPQGFQDEVRTEVDVTLDLRDRLKLLFGFTLHLSVKVLCEIRPGRVRGTTDLHIYRPAWWPYRRRHAVVWETSAGESPEHNASRGTR